MKLDTLLKHFNDYENSTVIQNFIAQANSRYILYNAREQEENFPRYTLNLDERCLHIAFSYLNFGWNFYDNNKKIALYCVEKASEILEHLYAYKYCDKIYKEYYSLICALGYYISSQYSKSFIVLTNYSCDTIFAEMVRRFLTRNFSELDILLSQIYFGEEQDMGFEEKDYFIYIRILANAFSGILKYIYTGNNEIMINSKRILTDLIDLSAINEEPHMWWIFRLLYLILDEYEESSLWSVLPSVISDSETRKRYIQTNIYKKKPVAELFKSQRECILQSEGYTGGFVVGMPTSSGKTKVAEISLVKVLSQYPDALCIYMAPFRSLANEIEMSLSESLSIMGYSVSHLYGSVQSTQRDQRIMEQSNIIIATPEKIKAILRSNPDLEKRIKLVIVDEGHLVGGKERYITSELLIEELKIVLSRTKGELILLSAVLPNLSDFSMWVSGEKKNIAQSGWRPSAQRFGELTFSNHSVDLKWMGEPPSFNNSFIESKLKKAGYTTKTGKKHPAKYFPEDKKEAVGATAVKMLSMGSVLIYVGKTNMVLSQARVVSKLMGDMKLVHQWENLDDLKYVELTCKEAYGKNSEIFSFIKQGIVCHSSKLPADVRQSIEQLMAHSTPKIVIATSTLGQGVNLGVSTVIFSNVYLNEHEVVDVKDFWNIAGRAGRAFTDTEGKILFAIDKTKPDYSIEKQTNLMRKYFNYSNIEKANSGLYILLKRLLEIANRCGIDYETFLELLAENQTVTTEDTRTNFYNKAQHLLDLLDDTLLAMSIKCDLDSFNDCSDWIDSVFRTSLAFVQAINTIEFNEKQVIDILKARNRGVIRIAGEPSQWKMLASSSIPLKASVYIDQYLDIMLDIVKQYLDSDQTFEELMRFIQQLDTFIVSLPISLDVQIQDVLISFPVRDAWFGGKSIEEIKNITDKADVVCNQYYNFHFPWIINAISKKMLLNGKTEESQILDDVSIFSEIGVPDKVSSQIYLAGVRSRVCSMELSAFVEENLIGNSVKWQLIQLLEKIEDGEIDISDQAYQWLTLVKANNMAMAIQELPYKKIRLNYNRVPDYEELYIRLYEGVIYLCTWDYKIKLLIRKDLIEEFKSLANLSGVYFKRENNDLWELVSENPYIIILQE